MVMGRRATQSPLEHLKKLNAATDRRHDRRALSIDELRRLLTAAEAGADLFGVSGRERTLIYRLAVESGLRSNELRSLTRSSFAFGKRVATVTVEACSSKRRRRDELPLRAAELLRAHVAGKHPGAAAFNLPQYEYRRNSMAGMIRADLAAARSAWLDESSALEER
jgi:integrase